MVGHLTWEEEGVVGHPPWEEEGVAGHPPREEVGAAGHWGTFHRRTRGCGACYPGVGVGGCGGPGLGGGNASSGYGIEINFNDVIMPTTGGSSLPFLLFLRLHANKIINSLAATDGSIQDLIVLT